MLSPYEMSLVQTAFGMSAQHTTSEPLRSALVKFAKKLMNIDRMIVEEDLDSALPGIGRIACFAAEKEPCGDRGHVSLLKLGRAWSATWKR